MGDSAPGAFGELRVGETKLEAVMRGAGETILFLHPEIGLDPKSPALDMLAKSARVVAPSHPGFDGSDLPDHFSTVEDLGYFYLDLIEALGLDDISVVGCSLGAWIAASIGLAATSWANLGIGSAKANSLATLSAAASN